VWPNITETKEPMAHESPYSTEQAIEHASKYLNE